MGFGRRFRKGENAAPNYIGDEAKPRLLDPEGKKIRAWEPSRSYASTQDPKKDAVVAMFEANNPDTVIDSGESVTSMYEREHPEAPDDNKTVTAMFERSNPEAVHLSGFTSNHISGPLPTQMPSRLETLEELSRRDPAEVIAIPMIMTIQKPSLTARFSSRKAAKNTVRIVVIRYMPRGHYAAHYAKNEKGEYIGTGAPAYDAGLVFVPNKENTLESVNEQVQTVVSGKQHYSGDWGILQSA